MKFDAPHFKDAESARVYVENLRWPEGRVCGKCGGFNSYETKRPGRYRCSEKDCRKDFTVTTGTVMESSHIPLNVWLVAFYMMCASKKGVSAHQLHRSLDLTYKSAWFLCHRIREAMKAGGMLATLSGQGKVVEADETYYGRSNEGERSIPQTALQPHRDRRPKRAVVALIERGGEARVFHVEQASKQTVAKIVRENVAPESRLHTDESPLYRGADQTFATHETVKHSAGEYVRGDVHTNNAEGFFGVFKKGMRGVYQHCDEKHLHRYVTEFEFRFNNRTALGVDDVERAKRAVKGIEGKRLTYRRTNGARAAEA